MLGDDHPEPCRVCLWWQPFQSYIAMEEYDSALPLCLEALEGRRQVLGEDDLAVLYNDKGEPEKAVPLYQHAVQQCRRLLGNSHPNTLRAIQNLGEATCAMGQADLQVHVIGPQFKTDHRSPTGKHFLAHTHYMNVLA